MLKNTLKMRFDRIYANAMANLAQGNDLVARNLLMESAGVLKTMMVTAEEDEREVIQQWIMDIGAQVEKLRIRIENDKTKDKVLEQLGIGKSEKETEGKTFRVQVPELSFEEVAGMEKVKETIRDKVIYPRQYPLLYRTFRKKSGGGILLYGLPGTGKTMIAKAIAKETGAAFFTVKPSDLFSKWLGNSEKNVKKLFQAARSEKNAVIFFDEIEGFAAARGGDNDAVNRVVGELLTQMQGVTDGAEEHKILLVAATNRPWDIDSAFLRPGRFDERIYVPLPDFMARRLIIQNTLLGVPRNEDLDIDRLATKTEGFNGADVAYLCEKAKEIAIRRVIKAKMRDKKMMVEDFEKALQEVKTSVSEIDRTLLKQWAEKNVRENESQAI